MIERSRVRVPAGAAGGFSSPGLTFCPDSFFGIRSTPVLPEWHVKKSRSFCQKYRELGFQLNTHAPYVCGFAWSDVAWCWLYGVHRTRRDGNSFEWHQPHNNQTALQLHRLGGYSKRVLKSYSDSFRVACDNSAVSVLESGE